MDFVPAVLASWVFDHTLGPLMRHACYPFKFKTNTAKREQKVVELKNARERVEKSMEAERRNGRSILGEVESWKDEADKTIAGVEGESTRREEEEERAKKRCFSGLSPHLKARYRLSKKAEADSGSIDKLIATSSFNSIGYLDAPDGAGAFSVRDHEALGSRESLCKEILDVLAGDDGGRMIGVHGMGGIGKTTLVKQVATQARTKSLFDKVIMATLTQNPDLKKIQGEIAEQLGMELKEQSETVRAEKLCNRLKQEKKILIILDDLWKKLNLNEVGIPDKDELGGCKILLTSREGEVLSSGMDCQKNFSVGVLSKEEAWDLFQKMASGDKIENEDIRSIATEVAQVCAGLPVAIVTVASALKNKSLPAWRDALRELRRPSLRNFEGIPAGAYTCIELSYNNLESVELKSTFLLCSLMAHQGNLTDLLRYGMGLGLFPNVVTVEEARDRVHSLVNKLKASCLLLDGDTKMEFTMNDVVRDVARSITSRDHHVFVKSTDDIVDLTWPGKDTLNDCQQISLCGNVVELPEKLVFPQLKFLYINGNADILEIPNNFFGGTPELKVLALAKFSFTSLPSSLTSLVNLQTLCLDYCELGDIAVIGGLENLEILSLMASNIETLPREIGRLHKLRLLDLRNCSELRVIPPYVLSKLSRLEELLIGNSFNGWEIQGQNNANLTELRQLFQLTNLEICIPNTCLMSEDFFSEKWQKYEILIGCQTWKDDESYDTMRKLALKLNTSVHLKHGVHMLLKNTDDLYLGELMGVKNVIYDLNKEGFPRLKRFRIHRNSDIQYIMNAMEGVHCNVFPELESFSLTSLASLQKICDRKLGEQSFCKLRVLEVEDCGKLENLFSFSIAKGLLQLQRIRVKDCKNMEEIIVEESKANVKKINDTVHKIAFTQLCYMSLQNLPHLKSFYSNAETPCVYRRWSKPLTTDVVSKEFTSIDEMGIPVPLFNEQIAFPKLEHLEVDSINTEKLWHDKLPATTFSFQNLKRLDVRVCGNLKYLFSSSVVQSFVQLTHLLVADCVLMEEIIVMEELGEESMGKMVLQKLESLELYRLPELSQFCTCYLIEYPLLKKLIIQSCPQLKSFISDFTRASEIVSTETQEVNMEGSSHNATRALFDEKVAFSSLTYLQIIQLDNCEKIWHRQQAANSFCKLREVDIRYCEKLVNVFPSFMLGRLHTLEKLTIWYCGSLEEIFDIQGLRVEEVQQPMAAFQLADLELFNLGKLKHIWNKDPQGILTFQKLHAVDASYCEVMENVFPFSITKDLSRLEKFKLQKCGIQEIVAKEEDVDESSPHHFVFPQLTSLELERIPKCRSFYPGTHTWQCPMLKSLDVRDSSIIRLFSSEFEILEEGHSRSPNGLALFHIGKVIPNLEDLCLDGGHDVASILWNCQFPVGFNPTLKVLKLEYLKKNSGFLPLSVNVFRKLPNLEELCVEATCLKRLFGYDYEGVVDEEERTGTLARLRNLKLYRVSSLRYIWEQKQEPDQLFFGQNLQILEIVWCDKLVNLAPPSASFQNLRILRVEECGGLSYLITSSVAKSLVQLIQLKVSHCFGMTEIIKAKYEIEGDDAIETEDRHEITFPKLESLEFFYLRNLTSFYLGNYTLNFPSLKRVVVKKCLKMTVFSPKVVITPKLHGVRLERNKAYWDNNLNTTIQHLHTTLLVGFNGKQQLKISDFPQLKEIWHGKLPVKFFTSLTSLVVDECPFFYSAVPPKLLESLNSLQNLEVNNCDSLEVVFDLNGLNVDQKRDRLLSSTELHLIDLPRLRHIWNKDPRRILTFKRLELLEIHNCSSLTYIFTLSMAVGLEQLQKMSIINCDMMEEIISREGTGDATTQKIVFPRLRTIVFKSLPKLTCIYSGSEAVEFISLVDITLDNSPIMRTFFSPFLREPKPTTIDRSTRETEMNSTVVSNEQIAFPNMIKLSVEWNDIMEVIMHDRFQAQRLRKLKALKFTRFPNDYDVFPYHFLRRLPNLKSLVVSNASFEEIILHEETNGEEKNVVARGRLRKLELTKLPKLMHLLKDDSQSYLVFQKLKTLKISECGRLRTLVASSASFQCLNILEVSKCHRLIHLMASTVAKCLMKLTRMSIIECEMIEQIIANEENDAKNEAIFHNLKYLRLHCLHSLASFCSGNCRFVFPSLEEVLVSECPKMKFFSGGNTSTPKLKRVLGTDKKQEKEEEGKEEEEEEEEGCWEGNLDATIRKLFLKLGHTMVQPNPLSSLQKPSLDYKETQAKVLASKDLHALENPHAKKDLLSKDEIDIKEQAIQNALKEPKITQMASTYPDCHVTSHEKEDSIQSQNSPIPVDIKSHVSLQIETDPQIGDPKDQVIYNSSISLSGVVPESICQSEAKAIFCRDFSSSISSAPSSSATSPKNDALKDQATASSTSQRNNILASPTTVVEQIMELTSQSTTRAMSTQGLTFDTASQSTASQVTNELENPKDQVMRAFSIPQSCILVVSSDTTIEPISKSTCKSMVVKATSSQDLNYSVTAIPTSTQASHKSETQKDQVLPDSSISQNSVAPVSFSVQSAAMPTSSQEITSCTASIPTSSQIPHKNEIQNNQVMPASSITRSNIALLRPIMAVEEIHESTSQSIAKDISSQDLTFSTASRPIPSEATNMNDILLYAAKVTSSEDVTSMNTPGSNSEIPSVPIAKMSPHSSTNFKFPFLCIEQDSTSSSQTASSFNSCTSPMALIKKVLMKPLAELAKSVDGLLMHDALKNLKSCPTLSSQQLEIIQVFLENFDSLTSCHSFHEQQIDRTNALKLSIDDNNKGIAELISHYEDLRSKTNTLSGEKEAVKKRLCVIEEEENSLRHGTMDACARLATRIGELDTHLKALHEADRQQKEAEDRARYANDYWANFRNFFALAFQLSLPE